MEGGEEEKNSLQGKEGGGGETTRGWFSLDTERGVGAASMGGDGVTGMRGLGTPQGWL